MIRSLAEWEERALTALGNWSWWGCNELARVAFNVPVGFVAFDPISKVRSSWRFAGLVELGLVEHRHGKYRITSAGDDARRAIVPRAEVDFIAEYESSGWSVSDAARRCGVSRSTIRRWVAERAAPPGMGRRLRDGAPVVLAVPEWAVPGGRRGRH